MSELSEEELKLEITTTEDRPGDIQAFFGRSDPRSLAALIRHLEAVHRGEESTCQSVGSSGTICQMVAGRIRPELMKDYGPSVTLVIRDTSGVPWDWSAGVERIASLWDLRRNPYDKGIWIVSPIGQRIVWVA